MDKIVGQIVNGSDVDKILPNVSLDNLHDYECMKSKIIYRLINTQRNQDYLNDNKVFIPFLDLTVCFFVLANDPEAEKAVGSIAINKQMFKAWNVTVQELYEVAKKNMQRIFPAKVECMFDMMEQMLDDMEFSQFMNPPIPEVKMDGVYVLTNTVGVNGSTVLCYDSLIKDFADEHGCNLYILPSSVHEVLLILDKESTRGNVGNSGDSSDFLDMVKEVNRTCVAKDEILADSVYYYDRDKDAMSLCAQYRNIEKSGN